MSAGCIQRPGQPLPSEGRPDLLRRGEVAWRRVRCMDCGANTGSRGLGEYPLMLRDEVWRSIVPHPHEGVLCRADMERRLGRPLTSADLLPCRDIGSKKYKSLLPSEGRLL